MYVDELLEMLAADAGANKHWTSMRCRDPETARGIIMQVLRRSWWGLVAFRGNVKTRASSYAAWGMTACVRERSRAPPVHDLHR